MYICLEQSPTPSPLVRSRSAADISLAYKNLQQKIMRDITRSGSKSPPTPDPPRTPPKCSPPKHYAVFRHNPLHDLESMFWIAAYFLFKTGGKGAEATAIARQQDSTRELFYNDLQRCSCIKDSTHFIHIVQTLHTDMQPAGFCLDTWRSKLSSAFYSAEKDCSCITSAVADSLHESLSRTLHRIAKLVTESSAHLSPRNRKRVLRDDGEGSQSEDGDVPTRANKKPRILDPKT